VSENLDHEARPLSGKEWAFVLMAAVVGTVVLNLLERASVALEGPVDEVIEVVSDNLWP
jgi:hypothetical protein